MAKKTKTPKGYIPEQEAATLLGVPLVYLQALRSGDDGPEFTRVTGHAFYKPADIKSFAKKTKGQAAK